MEREWGVLGGFGAGYRWPFVVGSGGCSQEKSGGDAEILARIQTIYDAIEAADQISDDRLMVFYQLLERFRQSKTDN